MKVQRPPLVKDRHSVIEQPWKLIFCLGLVLSLILGFSIRAVVRPEKLNQLMSEVASRIDPRIKVSFSQARLSLKSGLMPDLSIVITQLSMTSDEKCWLSPSLKADEIRLPFSLWGYLVKQQPFPTVEAHQVQLVLVEPNERMGCDETQKQLTPSQASLPQTEMVKLATKSESRPRQRTGDIEQLSIAALSVTYLGKSLSKELNFEDLLVRVDSPHPKIISAQAFSKDFFPVKIDLTYKEFPEKKIDFNFQGHAREAEIDIKGQYDFSLNVLNYEADVNHLPLSLLTKKLHFNPKQTWVSFDSGGRVDINTQNAAADLKNIVVDGDLGQVKLESVRLNWQPQKYTVASFRANLEHVDLDQIFPDLSRHKLAFMQHLGRFSGELEFKNLNEQIFKGYLRETEFIFSSRGIRQTQKIAQARMQIESNDKTRRIKLDQLALVDGSVQGALELNLKETTQDLQLRLTGLRLNKAVTELVTQKGSLEPLEIDLQLQLKDEKLISGKSKIKTSTLNYSSHLIEAPELQFRFDQGQTKARLSAKRLSLEASLIEDGFLRKLKEELGVVDRINLQEIKGDFVMDEYQSLKWAFEDIKMTDPERRQLKLVGSWTTQGQLDGSLISLQNGRKQSWKILGHRDQPRLERE